MIIYSDRTVLTEKFWPKGLSAIQKLDDNKLHEIMKNFLWWTDPFHC